MRFLLVLSSLLLAASLSLSAASAAGIVGGWRQIKNVSNPHVQEIARFAISEHNKNAQIPLKLIKVWTGETKIVNGAIYRLSIIAAAGPYPSIARKYEATVWEKSWEKFMELTSFKLL